MDRSIDMGGKLIDRAAMKTARDIVDMLELALKLRLLRKWEELEIIIKSIRAVKIDDEYKKKWMAIQIQLLEQSQFRYEKNHEEKIKIIQLAERILSDDDKRKSFIYQYELSGLCIAKHSYLKGLESALAAVKVTNNPNGKISALVNGLVCAEALDLERAKLLVKTKRLLSQSKTNAINPLVVRELANFQLREYFRLGEFRKVFTSIHEPRIKKDISLYQAWIQALPHIKLKQKYDIFNLHSKQTTTQVNREYKLDTLLHKFDSENIQIAAVHNIIDRIYLWSWRFFCDPYKYPIENLQTLLTSLELSKLKNKMTSEDKLLFMSSLLLLSCLDTSLLLKVKKLEKALHPLNYGSYPYLNYERKFIELYLAKHLGDPNYETLRLSLIADDFMSNAYITFNKYIKSNFESCYGLFVLDMHHLELKNKIPIEAEIVFNSLTGMIKFTRGCKALKSELLVNALSYFFHSESQQVSAKDFFISVFGGKDFDPATNYRQVFNVIQRLNLVTNGKLKIRYKNKKLLFAMEKESFFSENHIFHEISFNASFFQKRLSKWLGELSNKTASKSAQAKRSPASVFLTQQKLTRIDIQKALNTSKSTSIRILNEWKKQKIIKCSGKGPATSYWLSELS